MQKRKPQLALDGYLYIIDRGRAISKKKDDGQPIDASQTKDHNHAPSRADRGVNATLR